jgi:uncharacterized integral membrane protein (TIGR00697 family)
MPSASPRRQDLRPDLHDLLGGLREDHPAGVRAVRCSGSRLREGEQPARRAAGRDPLAGDTSGREHAEQRRQVLYLVLAGFFLGNALLAEMIGGKLFQVPAPWAALVDPSSVWRDFTLSCGVILWPLVFIITDIINEYFGRAGVRRLSLLGAGIIGYAFVALWICDLVRAATFSPVDDASFSRVFLQSRWIIVGSIAAFLAAQLIDVTVFWIIRRHTGHRRLWLRATGSTLVSQLIDTFVVGFIGLYLPWRLGLSRAAEPFTFVRFLNTSSSGYLFKVAVAGVIRCSTCTRGSTATRRAGIGSGWSDGGDTERADDATALRD